MGTVIKVMTDTLSETIEGRNNGTPLESVETTKLSTENSISRDALLQNRERNKGIFR